MYVVVPVSTLDENTRELKRHALLLSRRPTGTKLSADVALMNTSCGRGNRHGGLQAAFCLRVGLTELQSFFFNQRNGFKHRTNRKYIFVSKS